MPHIITGEIRKAPYTKEGNGNKGPWKMYAVELSERYKDKDGNPQYTNYRATFFSNDATRAWYDEAFQVGKVISISCDVLAINQREHEGNIYITLEPQRPNLVFSQREPQHGSGQQRQPQQQRQQSAPRTQQQQQGGWGQPQQPQNSGSGFDDDIPF